MLNREEDVGSGRSDGDVAQKVRSCLEGQQEMRVREMGGCDWMRRWPGGVRRNAALQRADLWVAK